MAKKTITTVETIDDLDGTPLDEMDVESIDFSLDGANYTIDLSKANAQAFRDDFEKYVKVASRKAGRSTSTRKPSGSGRSPEELAHVRKWAADNGYSVSERGRIKAEILDAFDKAN